MTMNCLEFRRRVERAGGVPDPTLEAHAQHCASCAAFARRVAGFDRVLGRAVRVPLPERLAERILLRQSFARTRTARWAFWPLAACVLIAVLALTNAALERDSASDTRLSRELVSLVEAADFALAATGPVDFETLAGALAPIGLNVEEGLGRVSFAGRCLVRGKLSGHLVLRDGERPVTVFLMPDERVAGRSRFSAEGWSGLMFPSGDGSIAVVAPPGTPLDGFAERVRQAVRWRV